LLLPDSTASLNGLSDGAPGWTATLAGAKPLGSSPSASGTASLRFFSALDNSTCSSP